MKVVQYFSLPLMLALATIDVLAAPIPDWRPPDKVGMIDLQGNEILPTKFYRIEYRKNGLIMATELSNPNKLLFNRNGEKLEYSLPKGAKFVDVIWRSTGDRADQVLKELPKTLLIVFELGKSVGLCNRLGKVLIEPKYKRIVPAGEDYAFLLKHPKRLKTGFGASLLNLSKLKSVPLSCEVTSVGQINEGIATVHPSKYPQSIGFVDKSGKVRVCKKIVHALPFRNGTSLVLIRDRKRRTSRYALINKDYKVYSPKSLGVKRFYRGIALARQLSSGRYGLVNKNFDFVVAPKFVKIRPIFDSADSQPKEREPKFYIAQKETSKHIALSLEGKLLFEFPEGLSLRRSSLSNGVIHCEVTDTYTWKTPKVYLNLKGEQIKPLKAHLMNPGKTEIIPGRLLIRIPGS